MEKPLLCNHTRLWAPSGQGPHPLIFLISSPKQSAWHLVGEKKMCMESRGKHLQFRFFRAPRDASLAALLAMNIWSRIVSPFFSSLLIFHLTEPNCPSLHESRQDSQNLLWPAGGTAMLILLSSCSEAHLTPLGGREPVLLEECHCSKEATESWAA